MTTAIQLIVGLGNPGPQYEQTRHNVGHWFVQNLAKQQNITLKLAPKFKGLVGQIDRNKQNCWLLLPTTYMNNSGEAVRSFISYYKILPETILVVHDELDFAPGIIRIKQNGGHAGHKGLQSIISNIQSSQFYRLRIGIGRPQNSAEVTNYVLEKPKPEEKQLILTAIDRGLTVITDIVAGDIAKTTQILHSPEENI